MTTQSGEPLPIIPISIEQPSTFAPLRRSNGFFECEKASGADNSEWFLAGYLLPLPSAARRGEC